VELALAEGQIIITRVHKGGPADEANLIAGTRIVQIDGQSVDNLPPYYVAERLRGEVGSGVDLLVDIPVTEMVAAMRQGMKLVRRPVAVGTVEHQLLEGATESETLGYLRITSFHDATVQEVREALAQLQSTSQGIKGLILDLRGNPGGAFKAAVKVSELFLPEGSMVVDTKGTVQDFNQSFTVRGSMNPFALPMVVLVDSETASAAEVMAGSLKESGRARVIGQTTFGKGTIQVIIPLDKSPLHKTPGGIRITVAKFFWPGRSPDGGRGVVPDEVIGTDTDTILNAARQHLRAAGAMMIRQ